MPVIFPSTECSAVCIQPPWPHQDCQFWDMLLALVPSLPRAVCLGYISPRYIDPANEMKPGFVFFFFFLQVLRGITRCYSPAAAAIAVQWILLFRPLDNKVDSLAGGTLGFLLRLAKQTAPRL